MTLSTGFVGVDVVSAFVEFRVHTHFFKLKVHTPETLQSAVHVSP